MKLDRLKEEIANIRRTQNIIIACIVGMVAYVFGGNKMPSFGILMMMIVGIFFMMILISLHYKMQDMLKELEKQERISDGK